MDSDNIFYKALVAGAAGLILCLFFSLLKWVIGLPKKIANMGQNIDNDKPCTYCGIKVNGNKEDYYVCPVCNTMQYGE